MVGDKCIHRRNINNESEVKTIGLRFISEGFELSRMIVRKDKEKVISSYVYEGNKIRKTIIYEIYDNYPDNEFRLLRGFDSAVIGVVVHKGKEMIMYDTGKIIEVLIDSGEEDWEALEHTINKIQTISGDLVFTDFPSNWK